MTEQGTPTQPTHGDTTDAVGSADGEAARIRSELREWVAANWDPDVGLTQWRTLLAAAGWAVPSWPKQWHGRGWPAWTDEVVGAELSRLGVPGTPLGGGMALAGPTILQHGPDALRERFLLPAITGTERWCQLFSEPGAGSDLAGLATTALLDGDEWVVNGQKVWNTSAHHADLGILLARTDWSAPKHRGITYFVLPMHQLGVEVRPLRQMNDHASFNEVFLTDARIPRTWVVGSVGDGWAAALTTLAYERRFGAMRRPATRVGNGRANDEAHTEAEDHFATYRWYPQRAGRVDLVVPRAVDTGTSTDPVIRQQIASVVAKQRIAGWTAARARAARELGRAPGPEGSVGKLAMSNLARAAASVHGAISGPDAMLTGTDSAHNGVIAEVLISVPAQSIAGGTDEIQHNIVGEKSLGLPREPAVGLDQPFGANAVR